MVDGFRFQNTACKSYLLTHFHSDHTTGLTKGFTAGLIFCTPITARLLRKDMGMPAERICELEMDKPKLIEGTEVTPIDANHCPGACMFLIKTRGGPDRKAQTMLHTGDLRWSSEMAKHPALANQRIDLLFLDTTYAKPTHTHPPQDICIDLMAKIMKEEATKNPRTLFVCGSYHIGKERAYLGAAKLLGWKVYCDANKRRVLKMLGLPDDLMLLLTTKPKEGRIHVDSLGGLQPERLQQKINPLGSWTHVVAFRPTGWTYRRSGKTDVRQEGNVKIYGIPYSEHSSFPELRDCVALLRPLKLVPTVNATNHAAAEAIVSRFADLMDLSEDRGRLDFFMRKRQKLEAAEQLHEGSPTLKEESTDEKQPYYDLPSIKAEPEADFQKSLNWASDGEQPACTPAQELEGCLSNASPAVCSHLTEQMLPGGMRDSAERNEAYRDEATTAVKVEPAFGSSPFSQGSQQHDLAHQDSCGPHPGRACPSKAGWCSIVNSVDAEAAALTPPQRQNGSVGSTVPGFSRRARQPLVDSRLTTLKQEEPPLKADPAACSLANVGESAACPDGIPPEAARAGDRSLSTLRADSDKSTTEHLDIDVASIDVSEQERIMQSIVSDRQRLHTEIAKSLAKTRQASMAAFLRRDKHLQNS